MHTVKGKGALFGVSSVAAACEAVEHRSSEEGAARRVSGTADSQTWEVGAMNERDLPRRRWNVLHAGDTVEDRT